MRGDRDERRPVERLVGVLGGVAPADRGRDRDDPVLRHQDVARDQGVRAGAAHAGDEPRVLDRQIGHRHQRQALVDDLAVLVRHREPDHGPLRVQAARRPAPGAGQPVAAVDPGRLRRRREHPGDAVPGRALPDVALRLVREEAREERADVHERRRPGGRAAAAGELAGHLELRADVGLEPAEPPRPHDREEAGLVDQGDVLLDHPPLGLGARRVAGEHRDDLAGPSHQVRAQGTRLVGGPGAVEGTAWTSRARTWAPPGRWSRRRDAGHHGR